MSNLYAVIMAGGVGSRFWPKSRERSPKQFLEIVGSGTMIQNTVARIQNLVPAINTFVVTNKLQEELTYKQLPFIPKENIIIEPVGRNTAPCIGLAASLIHKIDPKAIMIVLPADHVIRDVDEFLRLLQRGIKVAGESDALITIGIKPSRPETGYGYIQFDEELETNNPYKQEGILRVKTFAEKPNLETAQRFLESGDFLWNSGMFVWKARSILKEIEVHLPDLHLQLATLNQKPGSVEFMTALEQAYGIIRSISIDYGVMEKAGNVFVAKGDFGWSDVGSWDEVVRLASSGNDENSIKGVVIAKDALRNYVDAGDKTVALVGVEDLIVVMTDDAVLVCRKGRSQDVKEIVDYMRRKQMNDQL
jgi:mannose-1-phosphate guanylyltransferase